MPKTAVNENRLLGPWKNDIRMAGEILTVQPVAVSHTVKQTPDLKLGLHALAPNPPHVLAAAL